MPWVGSSFLICTQVEEPQMIKNNLTYLNKTNTTEGSYYLALCFMPAAKTPSFSFLSIFGKRQKEGETKDWLEVWSLNWESYQWEVCALCDITVAWLPELRVLNLFEEARDSLLFESDATLSGCCIMWDSGAGCTRCFRNIGWSHNVLNYWSRWTHSPTLSA